MTSPWCELCVNRIKRHTCVDTLCNLLFIVCTTANTSDDKGLVELLSQQSALDYLNIGISVHNNLFCYPTIQT